VIGSAATSDYAFFLLLDFALSLPVRGSAKGFMRKFALCRHF
jgi:hypothetical protein